MNDYIKCFFIKIEDWNKKIYEIFLVYSNLIFIVPSFIAFKRRQYLNSSLTFLTLLGSSIYHYKHCNSHGGFHDNNLIKWYFCDFTFAGLTIINYFRLKRDQLFKVKYITLIISAIICQQLAVNDYCNNYSGKKYTIYHTLWHLINGAICILIELDCYQTRKNKIWRDVNNCYKTRKNIIWKDVID